MRRIPFIIFLSAAAFAGCRVASAPPPRQLSAAFDEAIEIEPGTGFAALAGARFGGVSGLAFDAAAGELLGVSDDRDDSRIFRFRLHDHPLTIEPTGVIPLRGSPMKLDPEGMVLLPSGHLLVSSEGFQNEEPRTLPGI